MQKAKPTSSAGLTASTFLNTKELRQRWRVSGMFIWRMRRDGRLSVTRIGKRNVLYALADVLKIEAEAAA